MTMKTGSLAARISLTLLVLVAAPLWADDVAGSKDHPAIDMRYPDATIVDYKETAFDEYKLLTGKVLERDKQPPTFEAIEGKVTSLTYEIPAERSTLEVMRNYEIAFKDLGFQVLFQCKNADCGGRAFNHQVVPYRAGFAENYEDQRFRAARLDRDEGSVYASLYITKNYSAGGATKNRVYVRLDVIETTPMQTGMRVKKADELAGEIAQKGKAVIHSILFATDSAEILPSSRPALAEVSKLMKSDPKLAVLVVGHTDNQGALAHNRDLSERRAKAVVVDLVSRYGIASSRLSGHGVGFLSPVAPNTTDEGRKLNRRVELVRR